MAERGQYKTATWDIAFARAGGRRASAGRYRAFIPEPIADYEPELTSATTALAERAGVGVRDLNAEGAGLLSLEGHARQLLRSEALASSAIEGLRLSHRKLARAELEGEQGDFKAREVLGGMKAMEEAVRLGKKSKALKSDDIRAIHKALAIAPPLDRIAGKFREEQGWIGGDSPPDADYVGPPHEDVPRLIADVGKFMNRDDLSPVVQAAIAHAQFELIHPFGDGNGRVGRALIHVLFYRRGLSTRYVPPVSLVLGANKDAYISGLENFRKNQVDRWVDQFSRSVEAASTRAKEFSDQVSALQNKWIKRAEPMRSDSAARAIIEQLPFFPFITAAVVEERTGRSRVAALNGLEHLMNAKILTRHRNQKKGDSWEAKELFTLLDRFERAVKA